MRGKIANPTYTHERLLEVLDYNPETGKFLWKLNASKNVKAGMEAGGKRGYVTVDKQSATLPRVAWFYMKGEWPPRKIWFINGDTQDVRFANLRVSDGLDGFDHHTREGRIAYQKEYRKVYAPKATEADLQYRFGISLAEYTELCIEQNGQCAICQQPETEMRNGRIKALAVDHDHISGKIRGLLCSSCNTGIGKLKDSVELLQSAIRYLTDRAN